MSCVFCKIIAGEIPADKVYEDGYLVIFRDIDPKAKLHYLAVPKCHYPTLKDMPEQESVVLGRIMSVIGRNSADFGLGDGYRVIINQGADAGQTVFHLHIHLLGGQELPFADMRI